MGELFVIHCGLRMCFIREERHVGNATLRTYECPKCQEEIRIVKSQDDHCAECKYYWIGKK